MSLMTIERPLMAPRISAQSRSRFKPAVSAERFGDGSDEGFPVRRQMRPRPSTPPPPEATYRGITLVGTVSIDLSDRWTYQPFIRELNAQLRGAVASADQPSNQPLLSLADFALQADLQAVDELARLPDNWNTYGATAPAESVLQLARKVVRAMHAQKGWISRFISATGDSGAALRYRRGDTTLTWEIDYDDEMSLMVQRDDQPTTFHAIAPGTIEQAAAEHSRRGHG